MGTSGCSAAAEGVCTDSEVQITDGLLQLASTFHKFAERNRGLISGVYNPATLGA